LLPTKPPGPHQGCGFVKFVGVVAMQNVGGKNQSYNIVCGNTPTENFD